MWKQLAPEMILFGVVNAAGNWVEYGLIKKLPEFDPHLQCLACGDTISSQSNEDQVQQ
jgi:hypothetical protein